VCEEKKVKRKLLFLTRAVIYLLVFLVPPVLVGVAGVNAAEAGRYEGTPAAAKVGSGEGLASPEHNPDKPTAVVLLGNEGSEVTDVLARYAAAPEREAVPLSGGLDVLPQLSLAELDRRLGGEDPDLIVVPAMPSVGSPVHRPVAEWLREHAEGSGTVVSVCAGAEVLADTGLLDGRRATANWAGIDKWERRYPETEWVRGLRYVEDGNVLTAAAVTSGVGTTLHVVRGYVGGAAARDLAREIGYPDRRLGDEPRIPAKHLTISDVALYVLGAAYGWGKPRIGVVLPEGVSEIELASVFDVYPGQSFTANTTTLAPGGTHSPVRSEHGLYFVPRSDLASAPKLDRVLVPGRDAPSAIGPRVSSWARDRGLKLEFIHAGTSAGFPFDATLSDLVEHENVPVAQFRAKGLEYPTEGLHLSGDGWPFPLLLRPLAVGFLGLALAVLVDRLLSPATKRLRHSPEGPSA
jgi:putative intracellular protease/amidase